MRPLTMHPNEVAMTRNRGRTIIVLALLTAAGALTACVEDKVLAPPPPEPAELVHYWHFNALPSGTLTAVPADVSVLAGAEITYPGTGAGYMDNVDPGSDINAREGAPAGLGLRPRNPANTRALIIVAPSTGYGDIVVTWAVQRSGSGAQQEEFAYSIDGGTTWVPVGGVIPIAETWELRTIDLSAIAAVENLAALRFRILFSGVGSDGDSGNNRLDNIAVMGVPLP